MADTQVVPTRSVWLVIAGALALATILYGFVISVLLAGVTAPLVAEPEIPRAVFWGAAAAAVVASMLWTQLRLRGPLLAAARLVPPGKVFGPAEFQLRSIISLALAEMACIFGFLQTMLYRTPLRDYLPFGAAAFLVIVLDTIPVGLKYWSAWEEQTRTSS